MSVQTRKLVMIALGSDGLLPDVEDGNHLRWQYDPALGPPPNGFDLFRRQHLPGAAGPLTLVPDNAGKVALSGLYRALTISLRLDSGPGQVAVVFQGAPMAEVPSGGAIGAVVTLGFEADAIDELDVPPGTTIVNAAGVLALQDKDVGWGTPLNGATRVCLPVTDPNYPCKHSHPGNDWAEAASRLSRQTTPGGAVTLPAAIAARYGGTNFADLSAMLRVMAAKAPSPIPNTPTGGLTGPTAQIDPAELVTIAGIDPNIARIVGLLWVDRTAAPGSEYDYKIVGYWSGPTVPKITCTDVGGVAPGTVIGPGTVIVPRIPLVPMPATPVPGPATVSNVHTPSLLDRFRTRVFGGDAVTGPIADGGIRIETSSGASVVAVDSPWGIATGVATGPGVTTGPSGGTGPGGGPGSGGGPPFRFRLAKPANQVIIKLFGVSPRLQVTAFAPSGASMNATVEVQTAGGGFGTVTVTATGIGGIQIIGPAIVVQVCTVEQVATLLTEEWICFRVFRKLPLPLETPTPLVMALPLAPTDSAPLVRPSTIFGQSWIGAGVNWQLAAGSTAMLPRTAIVYHVLRRGLGNGNSPDPSVNLNDFTHYQRLTEETTAGGWVLPMPVLPSPDVVTPEATPPSGWPSGSKRFIDPDVRDRWSAYAVQGVDLFGRSSLPGVQTGNFNDFVAPPPPIDLEARFIDAMVAPTDPDYDSDLQSLIPSGSDGAVLVRWTWPANRYRQAPDAKEFRLYWQSGRLNTLAGMVTNVQPAAATSSLTFSLDAGQVAYPLSDAWLRVGREFFTIVTSGTGNPVTLTVKNLRLTKDASGQRKAPDPGRGILALGPSDFNYRDYRLATAWPTRFGVVPVAQPIEGSVTAVGPSSLSGTLAAATWTDNGDGTSVVRTGRALRAAAQAFVGGVLSIGGAAFPVMANGEGRSTRLFVANPSGGALGPPPSGAFSLTVGGIREVRVAPSPGITLPSPAGLTVMAGGMLVTGSAEFPILGAYLDASGAQLVLVTAVGTAAAPVGDCAWFPGYEVVLPNPGLAAITTAGASYGAVGVSSADTRDYVADRRTPPDPLRTGNEGEVSGALVVVRALRGSVAPAGAPSTAPAPGQQHVYATVPDFHSQSYFTLTWPTGATPGAAYLVYRAVDEALFLRDRMQRRFGNGYYAAGAHGPFDDDPGFPTWFASYAATVAGLTQADLTADPMTLPALKQQDVERAWEAWGDRFYPGLTDTDVQALADRAGNEESFGSVTPTALASATYRDVIDGRSRSRFIYRVRTLDAAGNRSPLGASSLPVYIPDVIPPGPPTLLEAVGGERKITLRWVANLDVNLDQYQLLRAETTVDAGDTRTMSVVSRIAVSPTATLRPGEIAPRTVSGKPRGLEVDDTAVDAGKPYVYRMTATDTNGNRSRSSLALSASAHQPVPAPPSLATPQWDAPKQQVTLAWTSPDPNLESLVERRPANGIAWLRASDWLPRGQYGYVDTPASGGPIDYRIKVRDTVGQVNTAYQVATAP